MRETKYDPRKNSVRPRITPPENGIIRFKFKSSPSPDRAGGFRVSAPRSHLAYACGGADMRGRMEIACNLVKLVTSHVNYNTHFSTLSTPGLFGFSTKFSASFYAIPQKSSFYQETSSREGPVFRSVPPKIITRSGPPRRRKARSMTLPANQCRGSDFFKNFLRNVTLLLRACGTMPA